MPRKKRKAQAAPKPRVLNSTLYCYVEPDNWKYAKVKGKELFGSHSAYVNALIAKDRGVTPELGAWKAEGEAKARRKTGEGKKLESLTERAGLVSPPSDSNAQQVNQALESLNEEHPLFGRNPEQFVVQKPSHSAQIAVTLDDPPPALPPKLTAPSKSNEPATEEQLKLPLVEQPSVQTQTSEEFETYE